MTQLPSEKHALFKGRHFNHLLIIRELAVTEQMRKFLNNSTDILQPLYHRKLTINHVLLPKAYEKPVGEGNADRLLYLS